LQRVIEENLSQAYGGEGNAALDKKFSDFTAEVDEID